MNLLLAFALCILSTFGSLSLSAQEKELKTQQYWFEIITNYPKNDRFSYQGYLSYRRETNDVVTNRYIFRPMIRYFINYLFDLQGGVLLKYNTFEETYNEFEVRPFQTLQMNWPRLWRLNFKNRFMFEERLIWRTDNWNFDTGFRFRYRIKTKLPINKGSVNVKTVYIPFSWEFFQDIKKNDITRLRDRNRISTGIGYTFRSKWVVEFEYVWERRKFPDVQEVQVTSNIFRFKVHQNGWIFGE